MSKEGRINDEAAWVLHSWPYRETSLLVDVLTRHHGRLSLVARGARRPKSDLRGCLLAFQPLSLFWFGRGEVKTLHAAEWLGGLPQLSGQALLCGFYVNELLQHLLHRDDPHETLFDQYAAVVAALAHGAEPAPILRHFELGLLAELGYGLHLTRDVQGQAIDAGRWYLYAPEHGPRAVVAETAGAVLGQTLLDCAAGQFDQPQTRQQARRLLRQILDHHLGGAPLASRSLLLDWQALPAEL